jgi:uncharacterized membrane protein YdbT with pleckstrin-like domain
MIDIQNGNYYSLGRKTFIFFVLQNSTGAAGLLLLAVVLGMARALTASIQAISPFVGFVDMAIGIVAIVAMVVEIVGIVTARLKYNTSRVMLDNAALHVVKGVLDKSEVAIPYRRLQSIAIKQSMVYRMVGVGHVVITTTTDLDQPGEVETEADDEVVPLMDYDLAVAIADQLTKRAEIERMQMVTPSASPHSN